MSDARARFTAIVGGPDDRIDIAEAALLIAHEEYPQLDVAAYLRRLDALADNARKDVTTVSDSAGKIARLNAFLFEQQGFAGNTADYYDPRNSYLNDVLDRRTGIPITLSVVYCEVAQRLKLPVYGVGFPGHFLVKLVADPEIIIDPFFATILTAADCRQRLQDLYGHRMPFDGRLLRPATAREILVRILGNLKQVYMDQSDFTRALACADRVLLVKPDNPRELRERGLLYQRLECFAAAARDLERYLQVAPNDEGAAAVRALLPDLQRQAARLQ